MGLRGRLHMDSGRTRQAVADYALALSLFPESQRIAFSLSEAGYFAPPSTSSYWSRQMNLA